MPAAHAQDKQLTIVLGFPAGAGVDVLTRMIADKLRISMNRTVIVENRPGASGRTAVEYVKSQPADGSAMLFVPMSLMTIFPHTIVRCATTRSRIFTPVTHLGAFSLALAVRSETPVKTLKEYVVLVKKDPSANTYGSTGVGTPSHFFIVMFERAAGINMLHVPHKGSADVMNNLLGGHIGAAILTVADISPQNASGKLRALAVSGAKREPSMPDVPTFKEEGYDIEGSFWYGAYTPAGTPADVVSPAQYPSERRREIAGHPGVGHQGGAEPHRYRAGYACRCAEDGLRTLGPDHQGFRLRGRGLSGG